MKYLGWIFLMFFNLASFAQDRLITSGTPPNLFVYKIILTPQNIAGLAEQYNVPLATLAKLNDVYGKDMIFKVGEQVKIPLSRDNFFNEIFLDDISLYTIRLKPGTIFPGSVPGIK